LLFLFEQADINFNNGSNHFEEQVGSDHDGEVDDWMRHPYVAFANALDESESVDY
jgi:hypothetical protein